MTTEEFDLQQLLSDILDDKKPLPTAPPTPPPVAETIINVSANANGGMGEAFAEDPRSFVEALLAGDEPPAQPTTAAPPPEPPEPEIEVPAASAMPVFTDSAARESGGAALRMPEFTPDDFAETIDIRNFATMVTLNTARWHAKVKDRKASESAALANDAAAEAFETRKRLLVGADDMLRAIHKTIDEARAKHYEMTLPWTTTSMTDVGRRTGGRLLPNTLFVEYTTVMADCKQRMQKAVAAFVPEYPNLIAQAQKKLGKRFDAREYPNPSSIAQHFDLSFDFQPIPKGDDFKGLPQAQLDALARKVNSNTRKMAENAMQDVWLRTYEAVAHMSERLLDPNKKFHDTLVENVRTVAKLLGHLNIVGDDFVEQLRVDIEKHLCPNDAKALREQPVLRTRVGTHAENIRARMEQRGST